MARDREWGVGERWKEIDLLREAYPTFKPFLYDVMTGLLGFDCSPIQLDIADFLENGPLQRMIQAQRGQAKTTITAAYAVWRLIHKPNDRILIISAGGDMATEIANWVVQIMSGMPELECMMPDKSQGDRASVKSFDVNGELKGPEKSPSIKCMGITSNMAGSRADVLIADDIESSKNSQTELQRERLLHLTKDFASLCSSGDIIYLGTPQSIDSVYNGLASRGYTIRIWPGRYPTIKEQENYGKHLAPMIARRMEQNPSLRTGGGPLGDRGYAVEGDFASGGMGLILGEEKLASKEIDQGKSYFQLQHMLDTRLMDADRFPLKPEKLIFMKIPANTVPALIHPLEHEANRIVTPQGWPTEDKYYRANEFSQEFIPFSGTYMYVDPAGGGQNGDETAYAVTRFAGSKIFVVDFGGVKGGLSNESLDQLTAIAKKWKPSTIGIEENFGKGALESVWTPKLLKEHSCAIDSDWVTGQKELRIIDTLEPLIGAGRLILDEDLLRHDFQMNEKYPVERRTSYSLFYQLSRITRVRDCLMHDDRLDALAGACQHWIGHLKQDEDKVNAAAKAEAYRKLMADPTGMGRPHPLHKQHQQRHSSTTRMQRRF